MYLSCAPASCLCHIANAEILGVDEAMSTLSGYSTLHLFSLFSVHSKSVTSPEATES